MKHIFLNLKRFDIPAQYGGVNRIASMEKWGEFIVKNTETGLKKYNPAKVEFVMYLPEAHIISAVQSKAEQSPIQIGSQSLYKEDTAVGGNFGAFTTNRTANAMREMGCTSTLIGHCEERNDKMGILAEAGVEGKEAASAVNRILNKEIKAAQKAGLSVLYCIGEKSEEQQVWQEVLGRQLQIGLDGVDKEKIVLAYEPIWSIGPGKTPADKQYIAKIAHFIKQETGGLDVVYGGGLKTDNAQMLAGIPQIDGGLIALTRFSGQIGFYPDEYLHIVEQYLGK